MVQKPQSPRASAPAGKMCPRCATLSRPSARFCDTCGTVLGTGPLVIDLGGDIAALQRVAHVVASELDLEPMLQGVTQAILGVAGAERCALLRWQPHTVTLATLIETTVPEWPGHSFAARSRWPASHWPSLQPVLNGRVVRVGLDAPEASTRERGVLKTWGAASAMFLPIQVQRATVGAMVLLSRQPDALAPDRAGICLELAAYAGLGIERGDAFARERKLASRLATVADAATRAARELDPDRLLDELPLLLLTAFGQYLVNVFVVDPADRNLVLRATAGFPGDGAPPIGARMAPGTGICGHVAATGVSYVTADVRNDPYYQQGPRLHETYAEIAAPIFARGEVIGVLDVQSTAPGAFDEADTVALRALAAAVGVAMENARLFRRIRADEHQLLAIIDAVPSPLGVYDTSWRAILANRAMSEVYGANYQPGSLSQHAAEIGPLPERRKRRRDPTNPPLLDHTREEEIRLTNPHRTFIRRVTPVAIAGETTALVVLDQDVTAERAALRAKDQLLSIAAHELRTPMTALLGFVELVQQQLSGEGPDLTLVGHRMATIRREARRIAALIEELLDLAQLEAGSARLQPVEVDAVVLMQRIGERFGTMPGAERLHLELITAPPLCFWDDGRIEQILTNLVDNALKYAPPPSVVVLSLRVMEGDLAQFDVRDTGPGISVPELATLFRPFARGESSARVGGGLGLGLYVSRVFAERHGGRLWLESTPGAGTTAILSLPFHIDDAELAAFSQSA